jgi:hypothetical protein
MGGFSPQRLKPDLLETMYVRAETPTLQKAKKKKPQISPLRYAAVEMTNLLGNEQISAEHLFATNFVIST